MLLKIINVCVCVCVCAHVYARKLLIPNAVSLFGRSLVDAPVWSLLTV